NGKFTAKLIVPREISKEKSRLNLRISAVETTSKSFAGGIFQPKFDGTGEEKIADKDGPSIQVEIGGETKQSFTIPAKQTQVTARFADLSGINLSSLNPDKTLRIRINDRTSMSINENYRAKNGDFRQGEAVFMISGLEEGTNIVEILAWDNAGNSGNLEFTIEVKGSEKIKVLDHFVFPNPSSDQSNFYFSHNRPGENIKATLEVYSLSGQILFSESKRLVKAQEMIEGWHWIFFQSKSKYPGKGTYIYNLSLYSESDFTSDTVSGKLVIQ
ncbi:MAG: T9SS type A sorting domain-containing protein, partial [Algoriphagus sp.]|nr:T9SS type A sorting domain-containing protein [Algoriphagus sp.]